MVKVLVFLNRGFETMEYSPFVDVCGWAATDHGADIQVETAGFTKQVHGSFGATVVVDRLIEDVDVQAYAALALPGGFAEFGFYEDAYAPAMVALIRAFVAADKPIASVCVGALALGNAGVLRGQNATTYHLGDGRRQRQLAAFGAQVVNRPVVTDGLLTTSWCPQTAPLVAFWLLAALLGQPLAATVKKAMGYA